MDLRKTILIAFVLSGMAALIYEVVWIRPLQFVLGSTIYTVSIILAAFMGGLALGSWIIARYADKIINLPKTYALLELGIGLYGILLLVLFKVLPKVYRAIYPLYQNFYLFELGQFLLSFGLLLIPTTLMGATFPVIAKFYTSEKIGKGIGEVYAANNIGAILGSFAAGFLLIPVIGIKSTIILAGIINVSVALIILFVVAKDFAKKIIPFVLILFLVLAYFGQYDLNELYSAGFTRTQYEEDLLKSTEFLYSKEGLHATVSVTKDPLARATVLLINGKGQGSTAFNDVRVNMLLSYLPLILNPESENSLVIGLGTGTTSGHLAQSIKVTTIEIEPAIVEAAEYFENLNLNVLENSNHDLVIADGRNFLLRSKEKYDIIVPEPSDPWQSFSTLLFSKEFFELVKEHLDEEGVYFQWVPIYEMDTEEFKSFYKTFSSVFPEVLAFVNVKENENLPVRLDTTEIIFVGTKEKIFSEEKFRKNFAVLSEESKDYLDAIWIKSADDLLNLLLFTNEEMDGYADRAEFITDDNAKLEFSSAKKVLYQDPKEVIKDVEVFLRVEK
ncbi:hypothetical protein GOV03_02750 [Candidatus Woesearchaeota archaeon]|nr:hypothetical protein [Candidatus Woesearchaeota archaeon]